MPKLTLYGEGPKGTGRGGRGGAQSAVRQAWDRLLDNPSISNLRDFEINWGNSAVAGSLFKGLSPAGMHSQALSHHRQILGQLRAGQHVSTGEMQRARTAHAMASRYGGSGRELDYLATTIRKMRAKAPSAPNWSSKRVENTLEKIQKSTAESARSDRRIAKELAIPRVPRGAASVPTGREPAAAAGGAGGGGGGRYRAPPGGYGGGGGRRGGGGRGIYAWHYRGLGHAAIAGAVGGASADLAMAGIDAIKDLLNTPQTLGRVIGSLGSQAAPAMALQTSAYGMGRAGGFGGRGLYNRLFPGGYATPAWMSRLGVTPGMASSYIGAFGIAPHSASQAIGIARSLRQGELSPAFAGMPSGDFRHGAAEAASMGLISPTSRGISSYASGPVGRLLSQAVAEGANRAQIFQRMDQSLRVLSGYGGATSIRSNAYMIGRFASLGTPSGLTGQAGEHAMVAASKTLTGYGTNPITTVIEGRFVQRYGASLGSLRKRLDHLAPGSFESLMKNPVSARDLHNVVAAEKAGNAIFAGLYLNAAIAGDGRLASAILSRGARAIMGKNAPGYAATAGAAFAWGGASSPAALNTAVKYGLSGNYHLPSGARQRRWLHGSGSIGFNAGAMGNYETALARMGVPSTIRHALIQTAIAKGINPIMAASIMRQENGGRWSMIANPLSSAIGPGQTTIASETTVSRYGGPSVHAQRNSPVANAVGAEDLIAIRIGQFRKKYGHMPTGREIGALYHGGPGGYLKYMSGPDAQAAAGFGSGLPSGVYGAQAKAAQAEMEGASSSLVYFSKAATDGAGALHDLMEAAKGASQYLDKIKNPYLAGAARFGAGAAHPGLMNQHPH